MTHDSFIIFLLSAVVANIDELDILYIVQGTPLDAATSIVPSEHLRDLVLPAMGLASAVRWLMYGHVDGSVGTGVNRSRVELEWRDRQLKSWAQAKRSAAYFPIQCMRFPCHRRLTIIRW